MKKNIIAIMLLCLTTTACISITQKYPSEMGLGSTQKKIDAVCLDAQELANSLHIQELNLESESETELLNSLGITILQNHGLRLVGAKRISGECIEHLDEFRTTLLHFDTGVTLRINQDHITTYPIKPDRLNFINANDAHPTISFRHFIQAIDIGGGHMGKDSMTRFIGVWIENEKYIVTPYKKQDSGTFRVYDDLIKFEKTVLGIQFMNHIHGRSGLMQFILEDESAKILIELTWIYWKLFSDETN